MKEIIATIENDETRPQTKRSPVQEYFAGKSIFVTGGTGYMGKVLVEKLLYTCYDLDRIFLLIRAKRGIEPLERIEQICQIPLFDRLRKERPENLKKIVPIIGDVGAERLGISDEDERTIIENVSIVFHCAATLKLEATLKDSIEINTAGTDRVLKLCRRINSLEVLMHVSTAFCCCDIDDLEEEFYDCRENPHDVYASSKWIDEDVLNKMTPQIIAPHKNTYTYTKRLAEKLVANEYPQLPVVIVRPTIVTPAALEPLPGWVDSLNGPVGLMIGAAKGVIRTMVIYEEAHAHVIPVDLAANAFIVIAWKHARRLNAEPSAPVLPVAKRVPVYNMTQDPLLHMTWAECLELSKKMLFRYPFEYMLWYPNGRLTRYEWIHNYRVVLYHYLPAYVLDFFFWVFRQPTFMVRIQNRITLGLKLLMFFSTRVWQFRAKKFHALWTHDMSEQDKKLFCLDFKLFGPEEYLKRVALGGRLYCFKETMTNVRRNRIKLNLLWVLDRAFIVLWYSLWIWLAMKFFYNGN